MLEYIYVCRHGFRSNWVDPSIKTGPTGMNRDPPLAAYGTEQAGRLADWITDAKALAPHPVPERVFSSPFYRCIQTAVPTYQALASSSSSSGTGIMLEHGVQEWYSPVNPDSGLHPRPMDPPHLAPLFPPDVVDVEYTSTLFPSRRGENMKQLQDRADQFVEAWTARVEEMGVKCVVVFAHAASVIALGRALTGDKNLDVVAGCASTSLYRRKPTRSLSKDSSSLYQSVASLVSNILPDSVKGDSNGTSHTPADGDESGSITPCGAGEWETVYTGRADYLEKGVERNWSFRDAVIVDGEVINDNGDRIPHPPEDTIPSGLAKGMDRYLRRGLPPANKYIKELAEEAERQDKAKAARTHM